MARAGSPGLPHRDAAVRAGRSRPRSATSSGTSPSRTSTRSPRGPGWPCSSGCSTGARSSTSSGCWSAAIGCRPAQGGRMPAYCTGLGQGDAGVRRRRGGGGDGCRAPRRTQTHDHRTRGCCGRTWQQVRASGVALDHKESYEGLGCVAAPIRNSGRAIAAVSVTGPVTQHRLGGRRPRPCSTPRRRSGTPASARAPGAVTADLHASRVEVGPHRAQTGDRSLVGLAALDRDQRAERAGQDDLTCSQRHRHARRRRWPARRRR